MLVIRVFIPVSISLDINAPTADTSTLRFPADSELTWLKILVKYVCDSLDPDSVVVSIFPVFAFGPSFLVTVLILTTSFSATMSLTLFTNT